MFYYNLLTGRILDSTHDIKASNYCDRLLSLRRLHGDDVVLISWEEVQQRQRDFYSEKVEEISEEIWTEAFNVLPPMGWRHFGSWEVFKMSECLTETLTTIYVRRGKQYYKFVDCVTLSARDCLRRVEATL